GVTVRDDCCGGTSRKKYVSDSGTPSLLSRFPPTSIMASFVGTQAIEASNRFPGLKLPGDIRIQELSAGRNSQPSAWAPIGPIPPKKKSAPSWGSYAIPSRSIGPNWSGSDGPAVQPVPSKYQRSTSWSPPATITL